MLSLYLVPPAAPPSDLLPDIRMVLLVRSVLAMFAPLAPPLKDGFSSYSRKTLRNVVTTRIFGTVAFHSVHFGQLTVVTFSTVALVSELGDLTTRGHRHSSGYGQRHTDLPIPGLYTPAEEIPPPDPRARFWSLRSGGEPQRMYLLLKARLRH